MFHSSSQANKRALHAKDSGGEVTSGDVRGKSDAASTSVQTDNCSLICAGIVVGVSQQKTTVAASDCPIKKCTRFFAPFYRR